MQSHTVFDICEPPGESLLRWAAVLIIFRNVDEVLLAEVPICFAARRQWFRNEGRNARLIALQDFLALEVAPVGNNSQIFRCR